MKKILFFTTSILCAMSAFSQVTIKLSDFPKAWEKYIFARDTSFSSAVSAGAGGTNQVWDFTTLFTADLHDTVKYSRAVDHPKHAQYPEATLYSTSSLRMNDDFLKADSTGVWSYFANPLDSSGKAPVIKVHSLNLPMTYGAKVDDSFKIIQTIPVDTIPFLDSIRITVNYISHTFIDAWGQLKLPNKTYPNILRMKIWNDQKVKVEIHSPFTKKWSVAPFAPPSSPPTSQYLFWAPGEGDKVLDMRADSNNNIQSAEYREGAVLGLHTIASTLNGNIYPNPATNMIYINCEENQTLNIYNAEGKQVLYNTKLYKGINTINIAAFESGIYFYKGITYNGITVEGRFLKQ